MGLDEERRTEAGWLDQQLGLQPSRVGTRCGDAISQSSSSGTGIAVLSATARSLFSWCVHCRHVGELTYSAATGPTRSPPLCSKRLIGNCWRLALERPCWCQLGTATAAHAAARRMLQGGALCVCWPIQRKTKIMSNLQMEMWQHVLCTVRSTSCPHPVHLHFSSPSMPPRAHHRGCRTIT